MDYLEKFLSVRWKISNTDHCVCETSDSFCFPCLMQTPRHYNIWYVRGRLCFLCEEHLEQDFRVLPYIRPPFGFYIRFYHSFHISCLAALLEQYRDVIEVTLTLENTE